MGINNVVETTSDSSEINLVDHREISSINESQLLQERLRKDHVSENWCRVQVFFGKYGTQFDPNTFVVRLTDGNLVGQAEVIRTSEDKQAEIILKMPNEAVAVQFLQAEFKNACYVFDANTSKEIFYAVQSQTIFHEGIHLLLFSQPSSLLAKRLHDGGFSNRDNCHATLLDEGITYALQDYFAPDVNELGKLLYRVDYSSTATIDIRKQLGKLIYPIIQEYLDEKKQVDDIFVQQVINQLELVVSKQWYPAEKNTRLKLLGTFDIQFV